jgi:type I restriction enzyme M protein
MANERTNPPYSQPSQIPGKYSWPSLLKRDGDDLFDHYRHLPEEHGKGKGMLGLIFTKAQNKVQDPVKLRRLIVDLIDKEDCSTMSADVKGTPMRAYWRRTRKTPSLARASTSPLGR